MWVIFEGLDKSGKTTLEYEFLKATNYKHIVIDRGPVGYMTFDDLFCRHEFGSNLHFVMQATEIMEDSEDFMVVYCVVDEETANARLKAHNETCPYNYAKAQKLYDDNIRMFYKPEKTLRLDTSNKTIDECVKLIVEKLEEVRR